MNTYRAKNKKADPRPASLSLKYSKSEGFSQSAGSGTKDTVAIHNSPRCKTWRESPKAPPNSAARKPRPISRPSAQSPRWSDPRPARSLPRSHAKRRSSLPNRCRSQETSARTSSSDGSHPRLQVPRKPSEASSRCNAFSNDHRRNLFRARRGGRTIRAACGERQKGNDQGQSHPRTFFQRATCARTCSGAVPP